MLSIARSKKLPIPTISALAQYDTEFSASPIGLIAAVSYMYWSKLRATDGLEFRANTFLEEFIRTFFAEDGAVVIDLGLGCYPSARLAVNGRMLTQVGNWGRFGQVVKNAWGASMVPLHTGLLNLSKAMKLKKLRGQFNNLQTVLRATASIVSADVEQRRNDPSVFDRYNMTDLPQRQREGSNRLRGISTHFKVGVSNPSVTACLDLRFKSKRLSTWGWRHPVWTPVWL